MNIIPILCFVILMLAGCREETLLQDEELIPDENLTSVINILSPIDPDEFTYGEEVLIKWEPRDYKVNIELYRKSDLKLEIATDVGTNGEYVWVIPDQIDASVHYRIKVILKAYPQNAVYSEEFTIKGY